MKDRRRPAAHVSHERWLVSYADFVTLLFAFFVVLYASAQIDKRKAIRLSGAIEDAFQQLGVFQNEQGWAGKIPANVGGAGESRSSSDLTQKLSHLAGSDVGLQQVNQKKEDLDAIRAELEKVLAAEIRRSEVALRMEPDGLVLSLREVGFFGSGSATIKPGAEEAFASLESCRNTLVRCGLRVTPTPCQSTLRSSPPTGSYRPPAPPKW
jgi:chemotaxis protein MotB